MFCEGMMRFLRRLPPALLLFFLSPIVAELLSGTQTPKQFFKPGLILGLAFYGCGSILIRERLIRWKKGWPSLLVLGAAYGILEEGLMVKCFFNVDGPGMVLHYGRLAGINWVLAFLLMIYHSLISISIPIMCVELIHPARSKESWVPGWSQWLFAAGLTAGVALGYRITPYRPPLTPYLLGWLVFLLLVVLAWRLPREPFKPYDRRRVPPFFFLLIGFMSVILFISTVKLPDIGVPFGVGLLLMVGAVGLIIWLVLWLSGNGGSWTARHRCALCSGPLWFFVIFLIIGGLGHKGDVKHQGKAMVGLVGLVFVVALARQARRVEKWEAGLLESAAQIDPDWAITDMPPAPKYLSVLTLMLMAPVLSELLSGYLPPGKFFLDPRTIFLNFAFYSCGAILVRELLVRWKKGWPTLLVLGAAYGILEEGLMTKAFFNPNWPELGMKPGYGWLGGVNWIMASRLMIYHSVLSISIPVVLAHFMFPRRREEPWINKWVFALLAGVLAAGTAYGYRLTLYHPPLLQYSLSWTAFFLLIVLASRLPREPLKFLDRPRVSRWWFFVLGLLSPIGYVVLGFKLPGDGKIFAWEALLLLIGFAVGVLWLVLKLSGNCGAWKARQRFALPAGVLMFFSMIMILNEQHDGGKRLVGLAGLVFVMVMARQARRVEQWEAALSESDAAQPASSMARSDS